MTRGGRIAPQDDAPRGRIAPQDDARGRIAPQDDARGDDAGQTYDFVHAPIKSERPGRDLCDGGRRESSADASAQSPSGCFRQDLIERLREFLERPAYRAETRAIDSFTPPRYRARARPARVIVRPLECLWFLCATCKSGGGFVLRSPDVFDEHPQGAENCPAATRSRDSGARPSTAASNFGH